MNPQFIDEMSWEMAEVYGSITDQILINLSKYFPYFKPGDPVPRSSFEYQARMLAQMGKVTNETIRIIANGLGGANSALVGVLEAAIMESVRKAEPELLKGVKQGLLHPKQPPVVAPNQMQAFNLYYNQASQKLNLVNTVMLESTKSAYQQAISGVVADIELSDTMNRLQIAMDTAAGETITGVSSWNMALKHATDRMKETGITGFIDHAGHHWSAEAYAAMDIRTTVANTARAAVWETNQNFGNDLYLVSYHNGARPLCYDWQNKVISANGNAGVTYDLDGNEIRVYAQSETTYGEPAGLFGINCKHYPSPFIPGVSLIRGEPQDKDTNDRVYAESQYQRGLERKIREQKRDLMMMKAQGADKEALDAQRAKIRQTDDDIDAFCAETGRARRQNREGVYTKREFPSKDSYDVSLFEHEQKDIIDKYFRDGGAQQNYTFGQMTYGNTTTTPVDSVQSTAVQVTTALNKSGQQVQFAEKMYLPEYEVTRKQIAELSSEFNTNLQNVTFGKSKITAAGDVNITGETMRLSAPKKRDIIIHEFAHTLTNSDATKYGLNNDADFWKEIKSIRTKYRKHVRQNPRGYISLYADSAGKIDEFMAEAFALGYMRRNGIEIPSKYGEDTIFSDMVLNVVQKYFGK